MYYILYIIMYLKQTAQSSQKLACNSVKELTRIMSPKTYCEIFLESSNSRYETQIFRNAVRYFPRSFSLPPPLFFSSALSRALGFCYSGSNGRSTNLLIFTPSTKSDVCCVTRSQALSSRRPSNWPSPKRSQSE